MKCEKSDKLIHLFLDGRLEKDEEREIREHLSTCEECAQKLALVKLTEKAAKKIEIKEPGQEYWHTFSSRVREKIVQRKEKSLAFGLKKALQGIFSFSPLKIKVAAGLISVVLVFIVGKLYVDYRSQEIVPSIEVIRSEDQQHLDATKVEKKGEVSEAEDRERAIRPLNEHKREAERKAIPAEEPVAEGEVAMKEIGIPSPPKSAEEKVGPVRGPAADNEVLVKGGEVPERPDVVPEAQQTGAGAQEKPKFAEKVTAEAEEGKDTESRDVLGKGEAEKPTGGIADLVAPEALRAPTAPHRYELNEMTIPKIEEDDTIAQAGELKTIIRLWRGYIEKNPHDSLANQGYLQVATAYYLLAKLSQDTTDISEGTKLIKGYLDLVAEPELKEELSDILKKISALKEK